MSRRPTARVHLLALVLPLAVATALSAIVPGPAAADPVRLIGADDHGVTLELSLGSWRLESAGKGGERDGRTLIVAPGLAGHGAPGRPVIPGASTLIALPQGARATARLIEGDEESQDGVRLAPGEKRGFTDDRGGLGIIPSSEPVAAIREGIWPPAAVEIGAPFSLRGQRLVALRMLPFRYDEAGARLWVRRRMRVRVDFSAGASAGSPFAAAPAPAAAGADRHWEPVFESSVINYAQGRAWRAATGPAARGASLFARPPSRMPGAARSAHPSSEAPVLFDDGSGAAEVRVLLDSTGVYGITFAQLAARGYPAGVPIAEVSVHRHEYIEDATPAYGTIELPIEVVDANSNGTFDAGDRILVYAQSWAERSGATLPQREWGDGDVIYVTSVARPGLRMGPRNGARGQVGLTPLASYPWTQRWEGNFFYMPFPGVAPSETLYDQWHWTPYVQYYSPPDTFPFETNDLDPSRAISFSVSWQGRKPGMPYVTYARVHDGNGVVSVIADSVLWAGKGNQTVSAQLPGTALTDVGNGLITWGRNGTGPPDRNTNAVANASLNWYETTYWRGYHPLADYLACTSGDGAGEYEILASGFDQAAVEAYDVTDPTDPRIVTGAPIEHPDAFTWALRLQDSTATGSPRRYVVFTPGAARAVPPERITAVTHAHLGEKTSGDYVLIAPEAFLGAAQNLAALRASQGLNVVVSPLEAVFDEFNGGRRSAWAIKRYIRFALNQWQAKFVLLMGEGTEDPHNYFGTSGPDVIPIAKIPGPVGIADGREIVPSDGWFVWCLNGCPPDINTGQPPPILPELFIGRLPATTPQEASDMVAKLATYEQFAVDQTWRNQILLFSDDDFSSSVTFGDLGGNQYCRRFYEDRFQRLNETIREAIVDTAGLGGLNVEHFKLGDALAGEPVDANGCRADEITTQDHTRALVTPGLKTRLNSGRMWWNYQGHANEFVLAHENVWRNMLGDDDKDDLVNTDMPFLFSAFSCHVNAFARPGERRPITGPPIGEDLVLLPRKGAIGSFASVGYEIIPDNGSDHLNVTWARAMFVDPPHDDLLANGDIGARNILGESIALAFMRWVPTVPFDPTENGVALTYTLLGDPATRLSIGAPLSLVTANGDTVTSGRPIALAAPHDTLHLEAELVSTVEIRSITLTELSTGGSRNVTPAEYSIVPPFPDTGPGGNGGRRYHLSYTAPVRPGVLRYTLHTVDRYGLNNDFAVVFQFSSHLLASGNVLAENDAVLPNAALSLKLALPTPVTSPQTQIAVAIDSLPQAFTATQLDTVGRNLQLVWSHAPYAFGTHQVTVTVFDSLKVTHHFRVNDPSASGSRLLSSVLAFPNPFDEEIGTTFGMYLEADVAADVVLSVFSTNGRLLYRRMEHGLGPGYHQWPWNGRDDVGDLLANGVYLFKVTATAGSRHDSQEGRLVKLRRPHHAATVTQ